MIGEIDLPEKIIISLSSENKDFAVKSGPIQPYGKSFSKIVFGLIFFGFAYGCLTILPDEFFNGEAMRVIKEAFTKASGTDENQGLIFVFILFIIMAGVGFFQLIPGLISIFRRGGYFVGTPARIVNYRRGEMKSFDWGQFNGNIEIHGTNKRGSITLEMRTGYMVSTRGSSKYVPNEVYISDVSGIFEIEQICRKRIRENDPARASE